MFGQVTNLTDAAPFDAWAIGADNARYAFALFGSGTSSDYLVPPTANNSSTSRIGERVLMGVGTATEQSLYVNGVKDGANTASLTAPNQTNPAVAININPGQPTRLTNSSMLLGAIWSRAFSHTEAAEFAANPFCFLRY